MEQRKGRAKVRYEPTLSVETHGSCRCCIASDVNLESGSTAFDRGWKICETRHSLRMQNQHTIGITFADKTAVLQRE